MADIIHYSDLTPEEESAGALTDKTGNGHTGALQGAAAFDAVAAKGKVIHFPVTTSGNVEIPPAADLTPSAISVGAWINRDDASAAMVADRNDSWRLWFPDATGKPAFAVHNGSQWFEVYSPDPVPSSQWIFLQGSWDGGILGQEGLKLFVHGMEKAAGVTSGALNDSGEPVWLGRYRYGGYQLAGRIGEFLVKDQAVDLTAHRDDLKRWLRREQAKVIEMLEIHVGQSVLAYCSAPEPITATVYDV